MEAISFNRIVDKTTFANAAKQIGFDRFILLKWLYILAQADIEVMPIVGNDLLSILVYGWRVFHRHMDAHVSPDGCLEINQQQIMILKMLSESTLDLWFSREWLSYAKECREGIVVCLSRSKVLLQAMSEFSPLHWDYLDGLPNDPWALDYWQRHLERSKKVNLSVTDPVWTISEDEIAEDIAMLQEEGICVMLLRLVKLFDAAQMDQVLDLSMRLMVACHRSYDQTIERLTALNERFADEWKSCLLFICHIHLMAIYETDVTNGTKIDTIMSNIRSYWAWKDDSVPQQPLYCASCYVVLISQRVALTMNEFLYGFVTYRFRDTYRSLYGIVSQAYKSYILGNILVELNESVLQSGFDQSYQEVFQRTFDMYVTEREKADKFLHDEIERQKRRHRRDRKYNAAVKTMNRYKAKLKKGNRTYRNLECTVQPDDDIYLEPVFQSIPKHKTTMTYVYGVLVARDYVGWKTAKIILLIKLISTDYNAVELWRYHPGLTTDFMLNLDTQLATYFGELAGMCVKHMIVEQELWLSAFFLNPIEKYYKPVVRCGVRNIRRRANPQTLAGGRQSAVHVEVAALKYGLYSTCMDIQCMAELTDYETSQSDYDALVKGLKELHLPQAVIQDLTTITFQSRNKLFSWAVEWNDLRVRCKDLMKHPEKKRTLVEMNMSEANERLKFLDIDYEKYRNRPQLDYGTIEEGYEDCLSIVDEDSEYDEPVVCLSKTPPKERKRRTKFGRVFDDEDEDDDGDDDDDSDDSTIPRRKSSKRDDKYEELSQDIFINKVRTRARTAAIIEEYTRAKAESPKPQETATSEPPQSAEVVFVETLPTTTEDPDYYCNTTEGFGAFRNIWKVPEAATELPLPTMETQNLLTAMNVSREFEKYGRLKLFTGCDHCKNGLYCRRHWDRLLKNKDANINQHKETPCRENPVLEINQIDQHELPTTSRKSLTQSGVPSKPKLVHQHDVQEKYKTDLDTTSREVLTQCGVQQQQEQVNYTTDIPKNSGKVPMQYGVEQQLEQVNDTTVLPKNSGKFLTQYGVQQQQEQVNHTTDLPKNSREVLTQYGVQQQQEIVNCRTDLPKNSGEVLTQSGVQQQQEQVNVNDTTDLPKNSGEVLTRYSVEQQQEQVNNTTDLPKNSGEVLTRYGVQQQQEIVNCTTDLPKNSGEVLTQSGVQQQQEQVNVNDTTDLPKNSGEVLTQYGVQQQQEIVNCTTDLPKNSGEVLTQYGVQQQQEKVNCRTDLPKNSGEVLTQYGVQQQQEQVNDTPNLPKNSGKVPMQYGVQQQQEQVNVNNTTDLPKNSVEVFTQYAVEQQLEQVNDTTVLPKNSREVLMQYGVQQQQEQVNVNDTTDLPKNSREVLTQYGVQQQQEQVNNTTDLPKNSGEVLTQCGVQQQLEIVNYTTDLPKNSVEVLSQYGVQQQQEIVNYTTDLPKNSREVLTHYSENYELPTTSGKSLTHPGEISVSEKVESELLHHHQENQKENLDLDTTPCKGQKQAGEMSVLPTISRKGLTECVKTSVLKKVDHELVHLEQEKGNTYSPITTAKGLAQSGEDNGLSTTSGKALTECDEISVVTNFDRELVQQQHQEKAEDNTDSLITSGNGLTHSSEISVSENVEMELPHQHLEKEKARDDLDTTSRDEVLTHYVEKDDLSIISSKGLTQAGEISTLATTSREVLTQYGKIDDLPSTSGKVPTECVEISVSENVQSELVHQQQQDQEQEQKKDDQLPQTTLEDSENVKSHNKLLEMFNKHKCVVLLPRLRVDDLKILRQPCIPLKRLNIEQLLALNEVPKNVRKSPKPDTSTTTSSGSYSVIGKRSPRKTRMKCPMRYTQPTSSSDSDVYSKPDRKRRKLKARKGKSSYATKTESSTESAIIVPSGKNLMVTPLCDSGFKLRFSSTENLSIHPNTPSSSSQCNTQLDESHISISTGLWSQTHLEADKPKTFDRFGPIIDAPAPDMVSDPLSMNDDL